MPSIITLQCFPLEKILNLIGPSKPGYKWKGFEAKLSSVRLLTFKRSHVCVRCGLAGAYWKLERFPSQLVEKAHFNLYAANGRLMTRDHIQPVSKGGSSSLDNSQTMCSNCNCAKADIWQEVFP